MIASVTNRSQREHRSQPPQRELGPPGVGVPQQLPVQANAHIELSIVLGPLFLEFIEFHVVLPISCRRVCFRRLIFVATLVSLIPRTSAISW